LVAFAKKEEKEGACWAETKKIGGGFFLEEPPRISRRLEKMGEGRGDDQRNGSLYR